MAQMACPRCQNVIDAAPGNIARCPRCGFQDRVPAGQPAPSPPPQYAPQYASQHAPQYAPQYAAAGPYAGRPPPSEGLAIAGLLINILLISGVGSLVGGRTTEGIWQLVMLGVGFLLIFTIVGIILAIPLFIASWIWGLVTGIQMIQDANRAKQTQGYGYA